MKTLLTSLFIAAVLAFGNTAPALAGNQPKPSAPVHSYQSSLYTDAEGKLRVAVDKLVGGIVEIRLVDTNGKHYFVQRVGRQQRMARLKMNINDLPDGAYQVVITDGVNTKINKITIATEQPTFAGRLVALN